jgi:hypothetical protein
MLHVILYYTKWPTAVASLGKSRSELITLLFPGCRQLCTETNEAHKTSLTFSRASQECDCFGVEEVVQLASLLDLCHLVIYPSWIYVASIGFSMNEKLFHKGHRMLGQLQSK